MSDVSPFFLLMRGVFRCLRGFFFLFFQIDASCCAQWKGRVSELTTTKSSWLATTAPPKQTDHCHVTAHIYRYIWCIYGIFGRETTIHTVIYGADIRFWPPLKWSQSCHSKMMTVMSQQNDHCHVTAKWWQSCHSKMITVMSQQNDHCHVTANMPLTSWSTDTWPAEPRKGCYQKLGQSTSHCLPSRGRGGSVRCHLRNKKQVKFQ